MHRVVTDYLTPNLKYLSNNLRQDIYPLYRISILFMIPHTIKTYENEGNMILSHAGTPTHDLQLYTPLLSNLSLVG